MQQYTITYMYISKYVEGKQEGGGNKHLYGGARQPLFFGKQSNGYVICLPFPPLLTPQKLTLTLKGRDIEKVIISRQWSFSQVNIFLPNVKCTTTLQGKHFGGRFLKEHSIVVLAKLCSIHIELNPQKIFFFSQVSNTYQFTKQDFFNVPTFKYKG